MSKLDYAAAFAAYPRLHALYKLVHTLLLEYPLYRATAESPFMVTHGGHLYHGEIDAADVMRHWRITNERLLTDELEILARGLLEGQYDKSELTLIEARSEALLHWLNRFRHRADRVSIKVQTRSSGLH